MEKLIQKWGDAWNERSVEKMLECFHDEGVYYDAFWDETCIKANFHEYFSAYFNLPGVDKIAHETIAMVVVSESRCITRYVSKLTGESGVEEVVHFGNEFVDVRDGLILNIKDVCSVFDIEELRDAANAWKPLVVNRKYSKSGMRPGAVREIKSRLQDLMEVNKKFTSTKISLPMVAEILDVSTNQLSQVINSEYGVNFNQYLNNYRICHAKELLSTDGWKYVEISEIANAAGFKSTSSFYRLFKESEAMTPLEFKQKNK